MTSIDVEEISKESKSFARSCRLKIGGKKIITPTRAISVTRNNRRDLDFASPLINKHFIPFGEVYASVSLDFLSQVIDDDRLGQKFSSILSTRLSQLKEAGTVPYLMLTLVDNKGNPYNQFPSQRILQLLFDFIWGTPDNSIIIPPIIGTFPDEKQYSKFLDSLENRYQASIDRKSLPMMAVIPSAYRLIAPKLLERYWDMGCRLFAFDFENKKFGAFGYIIEKLHSELNELSIGCLPTHY